MIHSRHGCPPAVCGKTTAPLLNGDFPMPTPDPPELPRPKRDHRLSVPEGRVSFDLTLGRNRVRLLDLPTLWEPFVEERYAPFAEAVSATQRPSLTITCKEIPANTLIPLPPPGGITVLDLERLGPGSYQIRSHWQEGWIDLRRGEGELVLSSRVWDRFAMSLENFLRVTLQLLSLESESFLLHTAAVLEKGACHFFFGPSGAGKSTATAFSLPRPALSDDMVLVDLSRATPCARAVPFFMVYPPEKRLRGSFPIRGAFRLRQDSTDFLERLELARAVATISASVPFVHELGLSHVGLTELVVKLCNAAPVFDLHFTRSARFWKLIDALPQTLWASGSSQK